MIAELIRTVESFSGRRVLVVGDLFLEACVSGDADAISPEAPVPVLRVVNKEQRAGGGGSVSAGLAALKIDAVCCGLIGQDPAGDRLVELLGNACVEVSGITRAPGRTTARNTRIVGLAQHRHPQQIVRVDELDPAPVPENLADQVADQVEKRLCETDVLCIGDYGKGLITDRFAQRIIAAAKKRRVPVLVDPAPVKDYSRYCGATLIAPNRSEFCLVTGCVSGDPERFAEPARVLRSRLQLEALVITLDRDGVLILDEDDEPRHIPTRSRAVYDNTGAGDAVVAMLAAALAASAPLDDAVRLANVAGGLEVEKFGNVPVEQREVLVELRLSSEKNTKIRTEHELLEEIVLRRSRGEKVVFTNGCFDLLHHGHFQMLARCKEFGDALVVAVNSDKSVRMNKGPGRPIYNERIRAKMLAALESVDYVILFNAETPLELIKKLRPDVLTKGGDYQDGWVCGREFVEEAGGKVVVLPFFEGHSTTSLVDQIRNPAHSE